MEIHLYFEEIIAPQTYFQLLHNPVGKAAFHCLLQTFPFDNF